MVHGQGWLRVFGMLVRVDGFVEYEMAVVVLCGMHECVSALCECCDAFDADQQLLCCAWGGAVPLVGIVSVERR